MPPLPVIPNAYRCSLIGSTVGGVTPINVLHILAPSSSEADVGDALWSSMESVGYLFAPVPVSFFVNQIDVLPLDGTSPTLSVPMPGSWTPVDHYTDDGDWVPETCGVVSFRTNVRGSRGRGRIFLGPCAEAVLEQGFLTGDVRNALNTAWLDFLAELSGTHSMQLAVASYVHEEANPVTQIIANLGTGTQRRRLLQTR